jgi:hypothetical protein
MADLFHCTLTFYWGPMWDWKESTYVEAEHRSLKWVAESERGLYDRRPTGSSLR